MFDKRIGFSLDNKYFGKGWIVPYDRKQTYGKVAITCKGSLISGELANMVTLEIINYFPDRQIVKSNEFIPCEIALGYGDNPALIGTIKGEVNNVYTEYTGVDSKTVIQINTGVSKNAYSQNISLKYQAGSSINPALMQIATALGYTVRATEAYMLKTPIDFQGCVMDAISKIKKIVEPDGYALQVDNNVISFFKEKYGVSGITTTIKNITAPVRLNDGGICVSTPFDPRITVGSSIRISPRYYINNAGIFTRNVYEEYYVYQIDFAFSTAGSTNNMQIYGSAKDILA
mgnify:FL=1